MKKIIYDFLFLKENKEKEMSKIKKAVYCSPEYGVVPNTERLEKPPRNTLVYNCHLISNGYDRWKKSFRLTDQQLIIDVSGALLDVEAGALTANYFLSDKNLCFLYRKYGYVNCVKQIKKKVIIIIIILNFGFF